MASGNYMVDMVGHTPARPPLAPVLSCLRSLLRACRMTAVSVYCVCGVAGHRIQRRREAHACGRGTNGLRQIHRLRGCEHSHCEGWRPDQRLSRPDVRDSLRRAPNRRSGHAAPRLRDRLLHGTPRTQDDAILPVQALPQMDYVWISDQVPVPHYWLVSSNLPTDTRQPLILIC